LWQQGGTRQLSVRERERLDGLRPQLDQLWDLLRQRRAREHAGQNPDEAELRPVEVVENYTDDPEPADTPHPIGAQEGDDS
ncbi:MAG: DUF2630 family protein, partial [Deinococcus sp.]